MEIYKESKVYTFTSHKDGIERPVINPAIFTDEFNTPIEYRRRLRHSNLVLFPMCYYRDRLFLHMNFTIAITPDMRVVHVVNTDVIPY